MTIRPATARAAVGALAALAICTPLAPSFAQDAEVPAAAPRPAPRPQPRPVARKPAAPAPAAPAAAKEAVNVPVPAPAEIQTIAHARNAKVTACLGSVSQASIATVDAPHKAHSTWVTSDPDSHVFQSIVGLDYRNRTAPNAATIISATPTPDKGCDATTVQVYPTARSCPQIRQELLKDGKLTDELSGMPLIRNASGFEHLLLPAPGNGCVIVAVGLGVGAPAKPAAQAQPPQQAPAAQATAPSPAPVQAQPARR